MRLQITPEIMAKQRSKKLSAAQKSAPKDSQSKTPEQNDVESDNESVEMMEKNQDEDDLARLVLGDDAGFMAQLAQKTGQDLGADSEDDAEPMDVEGEEAKENLEDVEDAEVFRFDLFLSRGPY